MGLAGAGYGASLALEDIVARRLEKQKIEQAIAQENARMELERSALNQRSVEHADRVRAQQRDDDRIDADRRQRSNAQGVRRMMGERILQGTGEMGPEDRRGLAALQIEAGDEPTMLNAPKVERDPIADHEAKARIDAKYRRPESGNEKGPYVVGGNLVGADGRVIFRGQDASAQGPSPYAKERAARTVQSVDELMGKVGGMTAGWGSLMSAIPETQARDFAAELDTLKANVAFNELTAMREASKTGGALGSVAVREMELLQSALGALDPGQSPANLKSQLQKVKDSIGRWESATSATSQGATPGTAPAATPRRMRFDKTGKPIP